MPFTALLRVLLKITKFHLHKSVSGAGIIRNVGIIRGRALYEEMRYSLYEFLISKLASC